VVKGIEVTEIPPITRDHYHQAGFTLPEAAGAVGTKTTRSFAGTGFDTRTDRHTRHTAGFGGLVDLLAFEFCAFHDFTPLNL
jgi:hypothetical protein